MLVGESGPGESGFGESGPGDNGSFLVLKSSFEVGGVIPEIVRRCCVKLLDRLEKGTPWPREVLGLSVGDFSGTAGGGFEFRTEAILRGVDVDVEMERLAGLGLDDDVDAGVLSVEISFGWAADDSESCWL